jgi:hypothetical protein
MTKKIKKTSPVGQIQWFKLAKPDMKFKKYQVDLIVEDTPELRKLISELEDLAKETLAEAIEKMSPAQKKTAGLSKHFPITTEYDAEGNETGRFIMKFKKKAEGVRKDDSVYHVAPPAIFNKAGKPFSKGELETLKVPNGSQGKIAYEVSPYMVKGEAGISLKPNAALLLKLEQVNSATDFGFSASEFSEADDSDHEEFSSEMSEEDADSDF